MINSGVFYMAMLTSECLLLLCVDQLRSEDPLEYFNREVQKRRDEEANLWSTPGDPSHSEREDDRVLYSLIQARSKTRMGSTVSQAALIGATFIERETETDVARCCGVTLTESPSVQGYRRLSVDIEAMRDTRREVRDRWQTILENLGNATRRYPPACFHSNQDLPSSEGFMAEAESLLNVSAGASHDRMRNAPAARAMLKKLHTETSIFSTKEPPPERYLFILVRPDQIHHSHPLHLTLS